MRTAEMKSSEECSSQLWTQCIPEKKKRKNGISLKSWIFFRLLTQLHKLTSQLRGLFFTWMKCKSLKWCPLICFSVRTKKSFDTLISDTLPTAFFYRLVMFLPASERTKTEKKESIRCSFHGLQFYSWLDSWIFGEIKVKSLKWDTGIYF